MRDLHITKRTSLYKYSIYILQYLQYLYIIHFLESYHRVLLQIKIQRLLFCNVQLTGNSIPNLCTTPANETAYLIATALRLGMTVITPRLGRALKFSSSLPPIRLSNVHFSGNFSSYLKLMYSWIWRFNNNTPHVCGKPFQSMSVKILCVKLFFFFFFLLYIGIVPVSFHILASV